MGGGFAAGGGDLTGGECLDGVNIIGLGRELVFEGLAIEVGMCVGVASGGNKILCEVSGIVGFLERKTGISVSPLTLMSERDDRTAWVAFVGEKGLMGRSRGLVGMEASGDGARVRAGDML